VLKNANVVYLYLFTSSLLFLFSSIHHTFSCHSNEVWNCCYKLDLTGIIFQLISATICATNFMFHDFEVLRKNYTILFLFIGVVTASLSLFDFFISAKMNIFVMFLYASLFLISFTSSIHWIAIGHIEEIEKMSGYLLTGFLFLFIGFILFMAKFPECVIQHKIIDYFLQSHILWHVCCVGASVSFYLMFYNYNLLLKNNK
jgi:predicted membrane channel-forming protein YqfA (hemolysin III family)